MTAMVARVDAAAAAEARERRQLAPLAAARSRTAEVLAVATKLVEAAGAPSSAGSRRIAEAYLATARGVPAASRGRRRRGGLGEGRDDVEGPRGPVRGGARPLAPGRGAARERRRALRPGGALAGPCWRRSASRSGWARGRSSAISRSSPAARGSTCRTRWPRCCAARTGPRPPRRSSSRSARSRTGTAGPRSCRTIAGRPEPGGPPAGHVRAQRPRARGPGARRAGPDEPRDRGAPVHQPEDGRRPRREHPVQAGGVGSRRGGGRRDPAGADGAGSLRDLGVSGPGHHETRREGLRASRVAYRFASELAPGKAAK